MHKLVCLRISLGKVPRGREKFWEYWPLATEAEGRKDRRERRGVLTSQRLPPPESERDCIEERNKI